VKLTRKTYTTRNEKIIDFVIGFVGFIVLNTIMWLVIIRLVVILFGLPPNNSLILQLAQLAIQIILVIPFIIDIALLIFFDSRHKWIAFGILGAFALLLLVALGAGLFFAASCLQYSTRSSSPR
jgi:hypothetical protein